MLRLSRGARSWTYHETSVPLVSSPGGKRWKPRRTQTASPSAALATVMSGNRAARRARLGQAPRGRPAGRRDRGRLLVAISIETGESDRRPLQPHRASSGRSSSVRIAQMNGKGGAAAGASAAAARTRAERSPVPPRRGRQAPHAARPARLAGRPAGSGTIACGCLARAQCCSSGAIVRPASESCSQ